MAQTVTAVAADLPTALAETPDLPFDPAAAPATELDRQIEVAVAAGFPALLGLTPATLRSTLAPLHEVLAHALASTAPSGHGDAEDQVAVVLVVGPELDPNDVVPAMRRGGRPGVSVLGREEAPGYRPVVDLPTGAAYLLLGVDTGSELCGVTPEDAVATLTARGRTPLTIAEGLALVVARPDLLRPNRCFSLAASRTSNQRVPAVWISERRPKLGWCWDRNPHTWLGTASVARRAGVADLPA